MAAEPTPEPATVTSSGEPLAPLLHGVTFRRVPLHLDDRGSVCEMFDVRWNWHPDPLVFVYCFTIRPGKVKGWGLHKEHQDRYFVLVGELEVVMYDVRPDSPTHGRIFRVVLSEFDRRLMNIPANVWHANRNIGNKDTVVVNFPTKPYDHAHPDKYRLPIDTDQIPYKFDGASGW
ncbi:MAG TPA: dTDP-4-dehydrorhamnose 3,5-epimerase family protein [Chthoniobacterales bacterium]|jgi:dTDP-4-dehydrorhamnose 3,5-epimerase|nr:dTDP-4-dehydrorhamnose 3,5-epimerase family protein [Chthoniobacterales bacterium]